MRRTEQVAAVLCHGSLLLGVPVLLPLLVSLLYPRLRGPSPYVRQQALQSLVFHVAVSLVAGALLVLALVSGLFVVVQAALAVQSLPETWYVPFLLLFASAIVLLWASLVALVATVKVIQGKPYQLPLVKGWVG